ncbi:MAG: LysM peptidoglycan-binding domain-containing protein, partial [Caldilineaceae bacterium]|nr:LysM peptidoglycan-binding domain-containing protein [Caldilineaceae bacterium]
MVALALFLALIGTLAAPRMADAQDGSDGSTYTVAPGDTLGAIATRYSVPLDALIAANGIQDPSLIRAGQELIIPNADGSLPIAAVAAVTETGAVRALAGETIATLAARFGQEPALVGELNGAPVSRRLFPGQPVRIPGQAVPPPSVNFGAITAVDAPAAIVQGRTGRIYVDTSRPLLLRGDWNGQPLI